MHATNSRPPPTVLLIHTGDSYQDHVAYLMKAGLRVFETHGDHAVSEATRLQPDIVVLDFGCDGVTTAQLKADSTTTHIPVIALVDLIR